MLLGVYLECFACLSLFLLFCFCLQGTVQYSTSNIHQSSRPLCSIFPNFIYSLLSIGKPACFNKKKIRTKLLSFDVDHSRRTGDASKSLWMTDMKRIEFLLKFELPGSVCLEREKISN